MSKALKKPKANTAVKSLPKGTVGLKKPKKTIKATPLDECEGLRTGSFERLLRFCSHLRFGPDNSVRIQEEVKRKMQKGLEHKMVHIIRNAMVRRTENKGVTLMGPNVLGAFTDWAAIVKPSAIQRCLQLHEITSLCTQGVLDEEKAEREKRLNEGKVERERRLMGKGKAKKTDQETKPTDAV